MDYGYTLSTISFIAAISEFICGNMLLQSTGLLVTSVTLLILDFFTTSHIYVWAIIESDK